MEHLSPEGSSLRGLSAERIIKMMKRILLLLFLVLAISTGAIAEEYIPAALVDGIPIPEVLLRVQLATAGLMAEAGGEDPSDAEAAARKAILDKLILEQACINDAERNGITLMGEVLQDADQRHEKMIGQAESYVHLSYPNLTGPELDRQVDALLRVSGADRSVYRLLAERGALMSAYEAFLLSEMPLPGEDEIQAEYEALWQEQKLLFDTDENAFEAALLNGDTVVYRPVTLKKIQKAEFKFDKEVIRVLRNLRQINPEAAVGIEEEEYARLDETVLPVHEALTKGKLSFPDVLEDLRSGSSSQVNYFHESSTRFSEDYYTRAAAFAVPGEISSVYRIVNGYAILYYAGDLPACERVPAEEVREQIAASLLSGYRESWLEEKKQTVLSLSEIEYSEEMP